MTHVEQSMRGTLPPMAASDIRRAGFELVRHGYAIEAVDERLDELEERVLVVESATGGRRGRTDPISDVQFLRDQLDQPHMRRFPRARFWRRGYDLDQVDEFVDRLLNGLNALTTGRGSGGPGAQPGGLTAEDVRSAGFKGRRGGYAEGSVDETLDRVVEVLLVQRRAVDATVISGPPETDVEPAGPAG